MIPQGKRERVRRQRRDRSLFCREKWFSNEGTGAKKGKNGRKREIDVC